MASKSVIKTKKYEGQNATEASGDLSFEIAKLKKDIQTRRLASINEKLRANAKTVETSTAQLYELSQGRRDLCLTDQNGSKDKLLYRMKNSPSMLGGSAHGTGDQELLSSTVIKLPFAEKIPPYVSWIFLDKNQRMAEDQSVVGRRQIYYDQGCGEALISSDSDEEIAEPEGKNEFSEGADQLLWTVLQKNGLTEEVLNNLSQFFEATPSQIQNRYKILMENHTKTVEGSASEKDIFLDKSLSAALDSFDNLFCRRCLEFDCRLHGCSQSIITPSEKQPHRCEPEENKEPCSDQCYLLARKNANLGKDVTPDERSSDRRKTADISSRTATILKASVGENLGKRKAFKHLNRTLENLTLGSNDSFTKKLKKVNINNPTEASVLEQFLNCQGGRVKGALNTSHWRPLEKDLYLKGIEIFGKNSCLIARNLLPGLKTCMEIHDYTYKAENAKTLLPNSCTEDSGKAEDDYKEQEMATRSRFSRRRGRTRKIKYSWKPAGHPSTRKRIASGINKWEKHYTPCDCKFMCGKECPCFLNGTCCEKYCGCSKSCKYRFRGCHCAKSKCRSRQCPCFAANRECDPDVCRNCWVSCGDGTLGEPPTRGDGYQCGNMRLLLKQQQKILLGKSDVEGWGAFVKNPINKNDYVGEYTGEVISHKEADKRGKIYDRENSSYLFDLNDQLVLDAFRKGDKLKFANHSSKPNCYAKVMFVAGDHRVGIFASEHIDAGEELFYDYCYAPDTKIEWARKSEDTKRDDASGSSSRARKHQSY